MLVRHTLRGLFDFKSGICVSSLDGHDDSITNLKILWIFISETLMKSYIFIYLKNQGFNFLKLTILVLGNLLFTFTLTVLNNQRHYKSLDMPQVIVKLYNQTGNIFRRIGNIKDFKRVNWKILSVLIYLNI